ncbi:MAG: DNA-protecting protein DprA [Aquabacterium sp.]|uniref:DNA-processing protein DprA n=1 Tax=Aquabacterium sp. TaxID=1872578 RepID=UPI0025BDE12B|nr:DNA-processing protein DprA [Aquabacterium sp.]MBI5927565.1 DNA-protecting protein DprA [Aquabacterium sp.]
MEREELRAWLRLLLTPRIGPGTARKLLAALGSPQAIFDAPAQTLAALVAKREATELGREPSGLDEQVLATQTWLAESLPLASGRPSRFVLSLADPAYPAALLDAADPPLLLFAQGQLDLLGRPAVAVVGSRHPTPQGQENAYAFAKALSEAGVTVVSGLALGVDGAAHAGALDGWRDASSGSTIAVVGTGLDVVYPKAHQALAQRLSTQGLLLSEFALGTAPLAGNFPKRNRIVAALSRGTLVIEAALQSGSLITARLAGEIGREVLAIPGSIHSPQARGCHALIKQGAKLVETAQDVLEELQLGVIVSAGLPACSAQSGDDGGVSAAADDARDVDPVLSAMGYDPVSQEALSARTGWGAADLGARLLELELMGQVARLPGALFQRVGAA